MSSSVSFTTEVTQMLQTVSSEERGEQTKYIGE